MSETEQIGIDAPRGWEHEHGYRLRSEGEAIEYQADGRYRAIVEAHYDEMTDGTEYWVVVLEHGETDPAKGHKAMQDKEAALAQLEEWMNELQPTLTAQPEHHPQAYRRDPGSREVSAIDHNGARYCLDCAREKLGHCALEKHIEEPTDVPCGGPVFIDTETTEEYHCDECQRVVETRVVNVPR